MPIINSTEAVVNPLQASALNKKGLCDYVINVASGCLHGCTFCYVPSTPVIRTRQSHLTKYGISDPQMDWGKYLLLRDNIPSLLDEKLRRKKKWIMTPSGKGVVLLCSVTDPYQNHKVAKITRQTIEVLLKHGKKIRILTRSPLWLEDIDLLVHPDVTVGMSLPYLDDQLSRQIEPSAPLPSDRFQALLEGHKSGCRLYVAIAPTPPQSTYEDFLHLLEQILQIEPEVIFWEPINARGTNGKRMAAAGLDFAKAVMEKQAWAKSFISQWSQIEKAADILNCLEKLHIWVDPDLKGFIPPEDLDYWLYRSTVECWNDVNDYHNLSHKPTSRPRMQLQT